MTWTQYTAEVASINGGTFSDPETMETFGPASSITYDIILHGPGGDVLFRDITPFGRWLPDSVDTRAANIGTPVGLHIRGTEFSFFVPEGGRLTECEEE